MIEPIPFMGMVEIGDEPKLKYCSSCMTYKPIETGRIIQTSNKNVRRFSCANCLAKVSTRKYERVKK